MNLKNEITELVEQKVISKSVADDILNYYNKKKQNEPNRLFLIFAVLGATLIALGLILIVAHNWDNLPNLVKIIIAFIPLLIGQALCTFSFFKKNKSLTWTESSSAFLFFALALCISLIAQIYNLPSNFSSFIFVWMLLCLPLVYILKSSIVNIFYIIGVTVFTISANFGDIVVKSNQIIDLNYFWMLALAIPHYIYLLKNNVESNFTNFHHFIIAVSLSIALIPFAQKNGEFIFLAYFALFAIFYQLGKLKLFNHLKSSINIYSFLGAVASICLLLFFSFDEFWHNLLKEYITISKILYSKTFYAFIVLFLIATALLFYNFSKNKNYKFHLLDVTYILFAICFFIGLQSSLPMVFINILILAIGVNYILKGIEINKLSLLNFGLLTVVALVTIRFFDSNLSFVIRGILFVLIGIGFFASNYYLINKRKKLNETV